MDTCEYESEDQKDQHEVDDPESAHTLRVLIIGIDSRQPMLRWHCYGA